MAKYTVCVHCGAHLDSGERCDCRVETVLTVLESVLNKKIEKCLQSIREEYEQGECNEIAILHIIGIFAGFLIVGLIDQSRYDELSKAAIAMSRFGGVVEKE